MKRIRRKRQWRNIEIMEKPTLNYLTKKDKARNWFKDFGIGIAKTTANHVGGGISDKHGNVIDKQVSSAVNTSVKDVIRNNKPIIFGTISVFGLIAIGLVINIFKSSKKR